MNLSGANDYQAAARVKNAQVSASSRDQDAQSEPSCRKGSSTMLLPFYVLPPSRANLVMIGNSVTGFSATPYSVFPARMSINDGP